MRFLIALVSTALLALLITWFFPWWTLAIICALSGFLWRFRPGTAFLCGFLSIALLWTAVALWRSAANDYLLLGKMAQLFQLPVPWMYIAVSAVLGGLLGGLAAWSGALLSGRSAKG